MVRASKIAKFFLMLAAGGEEDAGEAMTHLKLQKLLYYAQGFHLAIFEDRFFPESIEAWAHGPVVNEVWGDYKQFGSAPIPADPDFEPDNCLSDDKQELLIEVWNAYGQFSAWKLREMTHQEPPWRDAYKRGANAVIPTKALKTYFKTQIEP